MHTEYLHNEITDKILKGFYEVYSVLGFGFLEKVYERALVFELDKMGLACKSQYPINVLYKCEIVGEYFADLFVMDKIIVEVKAVEVLKKEHELQLINYLKATSVEVGLLLNFGRNPEVRRKIYTNNRKNSITYLSENLTSL